MLLKKEIRLGSLADETVELDLFSVACYDYYKDVSKVEVRMEHTSDVELYVGEEIMATNTIDRDAVVEGTYPIDVSENYDIVENDNLTKTFSIIADKYQSLRLNGITVEVEDNVMYVHFMFDEWHYFRSWENHGIEFFIDFTDGTIQFSGCEYVNDTELRWRYDANLEGIDDFMCDVFMNDRYRCIGYADTNVSDLDKYVVVSEIPETACFTDEVYLRKRIVFQKDPECIKWELYEKDCNEGSLIGLSTYRVNYRFKDVNMVSVSVSVPVASVDIPLSVQSGYDMYQEQNINDSFVRNESNGARNGIVEMEKLVYHPVFRLDKGSEHTFSPIHKIKFNLHFRQREEDGWIVKEDGLWNGFWKDSDGKYNLCGDVTQQNAAKFFSYVSNPFEPNVDRGRQSDLLCYLGFNDSDVKYQKSKLKKSFLRLSYYDSPNRANQNLLGYATVFMDSGKVFAKMIRGANRKKLYVKSGEETNTKYDNAKVDKEPCFENHNELSVEYVEEFRLSSQIVVSDRLSEASSEGFYMYLWEDNDNGAVPSDVYMRVDFNHAGYGRVVPMTMPYVYGTNDNHVMSIYDIADKWQNPSAENWGWGVRANEKYSYIHLKYMYDSDSKRHVYYLDPDTYGTGSYYDSTPDELEINLYEPKIRFQ